MTQDEFYQHLDTLYEAGNPAEVERFLTFHVNFYKDGETFNSQLLLAAESELGGFYRSCGRYEEARELFSRALELCAQNKGKDSMAYATTLYNLGSCCRPLQENEQAEKCFTEARESFESHEATDNYLYACILNELALLYMDTGRAEDGIELLSRATELLDAFRAMQN